ncbi:MAG: DUF2334 domain-containing protein [Rubrivivax sp.]|nr:MAG: DUF2334 domain-containing protein [Rubrivivax sp.]
MQANLVDQLAMRIAERQGRPTRRTARMPPAEACSARDLCVVLHDVSPARWEGCRRVLAELDRCAAQAGVPLPMTLLVVPHMHGDLALPPAYLRWLYSLQQAGHELALHGLTHRDEGPPPRSLRERLLRHVYTASEGEFAALSRHEAAERLHQGRAWARALGLPMQGFVAPAWLMSAGSLQAVADAGFGHTCTLTEVIALPHGQALKAPSLVFSTRSGWRRQLSLAWNTQLAHRARDARLLRLELHPGDADHPAILRCWSGLLRQALKHRVPLRLAEAAVLARRL